MLLCGRSDRGGMGGGCTGWCFGRGCFWQEGNLIFPPRDILLWYVPDMKTAPWPSPLENSPPSTSRTSTVSISIISFSLEASPHPSQIYLQEPVQCFYSLPGICWKYKIEQSAIHILMGAHPKSPYDLLQLFPVDVEKHGGQDEPQRLEIMVMSNNRQHYNLKLIIKVRLKPL